MRLFSLVPLVWESNPKLQDGWCKTQPPAHRGIRSQSSGDLEPTLGGAAQRVWHVYVFITAGPITKLFAWGEGDSGGHALRETTSRGLRGVVCPSRTGTREEPGTLTQVRMLSLVHVVWELEPKTPVFFFTLGFFVCLPLHTV